MKLKELHTLVVQGKTSQWAIDIYADPKHVAGWISDGIDITKVENRIPHTVAQGGEISMRVWCFMQDLLHFRNPFRR